MSCFCVSFTVILNSTDFDFLLSKGASTPGQKNPRDSILERFDPILGRTSVLYPQPSKVESSVPLVSTILESSITESTSSDGQEQLLSIDESFNQSKNNSVELKLDQNNSGDGDHSQASSTTETYETASIGESLKVGLCFTIFG